MNSTNMKKHKYFSKSGTYCDKCDFCDNVVTHTEANATFYPEITKNSMFGKCEFCEKLDFENVNFVKNGTLKM